MRPRGRRALLAAGLMAWATSSGCVNLSGDFGSRIPLENLPRIRNGETTRDDIMAWFGPPSAFFNPSFLQVIAGRTDVARTPAPVLDDVWTYRFIENETRVFFVPILFATIDAAATAETLVVFFDEEGRVKYHAFRRDKARALPEVRVNESNP